jgi:DNA polymerase-1
MSSKTLLLDGDIIAYQCAAACEKPINWGDGLWTLYSFENEVIMAIEEFIFKLKEQSGLEKVQVAISDTKNFRKGVAPYYKENRKDIRKPMLLGFAKDYLINTYQGIVIPTLEADDVLGIYTSAHPDKYVCWSLDKDLRSIPGFHLIEGEIVEITEEEADLAFFTQTLTGDMVDNYPGCPKVGPKTAEKILNNQEDLWAAVVFAYQKAGLSEAVALENAQLARILRHTDYNFETNEVILWQSH